MQQHQNTPHQTNTKDGDISARAKALEVRVEAMERRRRDLQSNVDLKKKVMDRVMMYAAAATILETEFDALCKAAAGSLCIPDASRPSLHLDATTLALGKTPTAIMSPLHPRASGRQHGNNGTEPRSILKARSRSAPSHAAISQHNPNHTNTSAGDCATSPLLRHDPSFVPRDSLQLLHGGGTHRNSIGNISGDLSLLMDPSLLAAAGRPSAANLQPLPQQHPLNSPTALMSLIIDDNPEEREESRGRASIPTAQRSDPWMPGQQVNNALPPLQSFNNQLQPKVVAQQRQQQAVPLRETTVQQVERPEPLIQRRPQPSPSPLPTPPSPPPSRSCTLPRSASTAATHPPQQQQPFHTGTKVDGSFGWSKEHADSDDDETKPSTRRKQSTRNKAKKDTAEAEQKKPAARSRTSKKGTPMPQPSMLKGQCNNEQEDTATTTRRHPRTLQRGSDGGSDALSALLGLDEALDLKEDTLPTKRAKKVHLCSSNPLNSSSVVFDNALAAAATVDVEPSTTTGAQVNPGSFGREFSSSLAREHASNGVGAVLQHGALACPTAAATPAQTTPRTSTTKPRGRRGRGAANGASSSKSTSNSAARATVAQLPEEGTFILS